MKKITSTLIAILFISNQFVNAQASKYMNPYLQNMKPGSVYISWLTPDGQATPVTVEYGTTSNLGNSATGSNSTISTGNNYCTVQLTGLNPNTVYYYKCNSGNQSSAVNQFRTAIAKGSKGQHIIFPILGDTRRAPSATQDTIVSSRNARICEQTLKAKYGNEYWKKVSHIVTTGDIVYAESNANEYTKEFFVPFRGLSKNLPTYVSIGNHEGSGKYFFQIMKYEDLGPTGTDAEKYYKFEVGNCLFLMVNSNTNYHTATQINWFTTVLDAAQKDTTIDFIFAAFHHPGHSEIWPDGNEAYIQNDLFGLFKNYPKMSLIIFGHSHCYERGYLALDPTAQGYKHDAKILLQGGGGSEMDTWKEYPNQTDYPEVHRSMSYWGYTIVDVDVDKKSWTAESYNIGMEEEFLNGGLPKNKNVLFDKFHQYAAGGPVSPTANAPVIPATSNVMLSASKFISNDNDTIQSSQFQLREYPNGTYTNPLIDSKRDYENIYGNNTTPPYAPIDKNLGIDLSKLKVTTLQANKKYAYRVRYCDQSLRWSNWSTEVVFNNSITTGITDDATDAGTAINVFPNPLSDMTVIEVNSIVNQYGHISVYDINGVKVKELFNGILTQGPTNFTWNATNDSNMKVAKGSYIIEVELSEKTEHIKVVVQ